MLAWKSSVLASSSGRRRGGASRGNVMRLVEQTDPVTYAAVTIVLAAVALAARRVPALRGARVDPAQTMRAE